MSTPAFPYEVKSRDKRVRIYLINNRVMGKVYINFRIADYSTGRRQFITFSDFSLAVKYARKVLKYQKTPPNGRPPGNARRNPGRKD
ncbi:MAG TPA: hypothetical protein VFZ59_19850 [Verrucomicrobiae bacterium]|nr:hypothetical protein [Verrucomicrobiae bacterium]